MAVAGARFESYVKDAMKEGDIPSLAELSRRSGIAVSAWHGWFRGERQPRRNSLVLAGNALERTPEQLLAVWDGERPHKPARATETPEPLLSLLRDQTRELRAQNEALTKLAGVISDQTARQAGWNEGLAALAARLVLVIEGQSGKR